MALLLWQQYEFPFGNYIVQFSIFIFNVLTLTFRKVEEATGTHVTLDAIVVWFTVTATGKLKLTLISDRPVDMTVTRDTIRVAVVTNVTSANNDNCQ